MSGVVQYPQTASIEEPPEPPLGPFPIEAFPLVMREVAKEMSQVYQTPVCLPAMCALAVFSGAIGKSVVVEGAYRDKRTHLNLYVMAVADRGTGKGNIAERLARTLVDRSARLRAEYLPTAEAARAKASLLKKQIFAMENRAVKATAAELPGFESTLAGHHLELKRLEDITKRQVTLRIDDSTGEALTRVLADNDETTFCFSSEAGGAIDVKLGRYRKDGGTDFDLLLKGYSCESDDVCRVGRAGVTLRAPCISVLWLVQPVVAQRVLGHQQALERGLTARFLIFDSFATREIDNRNGRRFVLGDFWDATVGAHLEARLNGQQRVVQATPEAREVFAKFDDESVRLGRHYPDFPGEFSRWRENAIKIAGLFARGELRAEISSDCAARACSVVRWVGENYIRLLSYGRRERLRPAFDRIVGLLNDNGGEMHLGPLGSRHGIKREQIDAVIAVYPNRLQITELPQTGPGRPGKVVRLMRT